MNPNKKMSAKLVKICGDIAAYLDQIIVLMAGCGCMFGSTLHERNGADCCLPNCEKVGMTQSQDGSVERNDAARFPVLK
jgi:hypothetical protein